MGFNGSGVFTPDGANFPAVSGQTILASKFNNIVNEIATGLTTCVTKDGQTTITANLPMSGFRHTGVGNGSARTDYASVAQLQDGAPMWLASVSGSSTITGTATPSPGAYAAGQVFRFLPVGVNIGATTLNINSLGAKNVHAASGVPLRGGELATGNIATVVYDGTQFLLLGAQDTRLDNLVFNGKMTLWRRGFTFTTPINADNLCEGWRYLKSGTVATHTVTRSTDVPTLAEAGEILPFSQHFTLTNPDTSIAAGDLLGFYQVADPTNFYAYWQQPLLVSFWVKASTTGTYCFFLNNGLDRWFATNFTISAADTWEQKSLTVAASPSAGTWNLSPGSAPAVAFGITLAAGSTYQITGDSWTSSQGYATSSQVNGVNTASTNFRLAGMRIWQANRGGLPYSRPFIEEYNLALRRFQTTFPQSTIPSQFSNFTGIAWPQRAGASASEYHRVSFTTPMLANGLVTLYSPYNASAQVYNTSRSAAMTTTSAISTTDYGFTIASVTTAGSAAGDYLEVHYTASGA